MNKILAKKLRLIFLPFIIISFCIIGGYTFLNWVVVTQMHALSLKEDVTNMYIPILLPWIPLVLWLRPKIKLLKLKQIKSNPVPDYTQQKQVKNDPIAVYIFLAGIMIIAPTIFSQLYLETATGKLTQLDNINQIQQQKATKYYTLKHFYIDTAHTGTLTTSELNGKSSTNTYIHFVLPILTSAGDTINNSCFASCGIKYHKAISNGYGQVAKEEIVKDFLHSCKEEIDKKDVNQIVYFERLGNTDDHDAYVAAIKNYKSVMAKTEIVLVPVNKPFAARNGNMILWLLGSFVASGLIWLLMVTKPKLDEEN